MINYSVVVGNSFGFIFTTFFVTDAARNNIDLLIVSQILIKKKKLLKILEINRKSITLYRYYFNNSNYILRSIYKR